MWFVCFNDLKLLFSFLYCFFLNNYNDDKILFCKIYYFVNNYENNGLENVR